MTTSASPSAQGVPISFNSHDEQVRGRLYEPRSAPPGNPAVIVSPSRVATVEEMSWLAKPLAAAGYIVLVQGYRPGRVRYQLRDVEDVESAVSYVARGRNGHGSKYIALIGHSRGGSASLRAAARDGRITATIALSPPTDIARYMKALRAHCPSRYMTLLNAYGGSPEDEAVYYRDISPLSHVAGISSPVLLIHGIEDMVAPKEHSEWMLAELLASGNSNARLTLIEGAGHFFEHRFNGYLFDAVLQAIQPWLRDIFPVQQAGC